ncbi:MAG: phosphatase PAP2 family protein [Dehalococcoidia bacterium]
MTAVRKRLAVLAILGLAAVALTVTVAVVGVPLAADEAITHWTQRQGWLSGPSTMANNMNGAPSWLAIAVAGLAAGIFARRPGRQEAARSALVVLVFAILLRSGSPLLKELIESPRPDPSYGVRVEELRDSFGFPSGHVYAAVLVYGAVAWAAAATWGRRIRLLIWCLAGLIMLAAGPARIFVGAHWPSDVAGGYLWGAVALSFALLVGPSVARAGHRRRAIPRAGSGR